MFDSIDQRRGNCQIEPQQLSSRAYRMHSMWLSRSLPISVSKLSTNQSQSRCHVGCVFNFFGFRLGGWNLESVSYEKERVSLPVPYRFLEIPGRMNTSFPLDIIVMEMTDLISLTYTLLDENREETDSRKKNDKDRKSKHRHDKKKKRKKKSKKSNRKDGETSSSDSSNYDDKDGGHSRDKKRRKHHHKDRKTKSKSPKRSEVSLHDHQRRHRSRSGERKYEKSEDRMSSPLSSRRHHYKKSKDDREHNHRHRSRSRSRDRQSHQYSRNHRHSWLLYSQDQFYEGNSTGLNGIFIIPVQDCSTPSNNLLFQFSSF